MLKQYTLIWLMALLWGSSLFGQENQTTDLVLGLSITGNGYYGDLNYTPEGLMKSDYFSFYPGLNLQMSKAKNQRMLPMFNAGYGKFVAQNPELPAVSVLTGDPPTPQLITPNRYAETSFIYADFGYRIQLIRQFSRLSPYVGLGLGGLAYFPRSKEGELLSRSRSTRAPSEASYGTLSLSTPMTLGMDLNLSRKLSVNIAYVYRLNSTDYLDNIAELGRQAGNDKLHVVRFGASFRFQGEESPSEEGQQQLLPMEPLVVAMPSVAEDIGGVVPDPVPVTGVQDAVSVIEPLSRPDCDSLLTEYESRLAVQASQNEKLRKELAELNLILLQTAKTRDRCQSRYDSLLNLPAPVVAATAAPDTDPAMAEQLMRLRLQVEEATRQQQGWEAERIRNMRERQQLISARDSAVREIQDLERGQVNMAAVLETRTEEGVDMQAKWKADQIQWEQQGKKDRRLSDSLLAVVAGLNGQVNEATDEALKEKIAQLAEREKTLEGSERRLRAAEKQLAQREAALAEAQTDLAAKEKKYATLDEKEKALLRLEQQMKQYASSLPTAPEPEREEKIAAFSVPCNRDKKLVQQRIVSYFAEQGYTYQLEKGKLVYVGVILTDISPSPMNVSLYLIRDENDDRQLLGSFRMDNGEYLSDAHYPEESRQAKRFMKRFIQ